MLTIAFCYDLKSEYLSKGFTKEECLELDTEETIDAVIRALEELGHKVVKVGNIKALVRLLANDEKPDWDLAFNISEVRFQHDLTKLREFT
jgi:D-alanine-D-alanine ligase